MSSNTEVKLTAEKVYRKKMVNRIVKMGVLILLLLFSILYLILYVINSNGYFYIKSSLKKGSFKVK